jgi:hypothetical protein
MKIKMGVKGDISALVLLTMLLAACALHREYEATNTVPDNLMGTLSHP